MDWGGTPCNYREIEKVANEHKITIILDAAQSIGSKYNGEYIGSSANFI
jgi:dTDP-4-amino-4,6-dideoxygalactose transaminase